MTAKRSPPKPYERRPLPEWPADKPLPKFSSPEDEDAFWGSYSFADAMQAGEELVYEPPASKPREHVYRIRLDDDELAALRQLAKRRGVTASVVIRELVRAQWAKLRAGGLLGPNKGRR